jgi:hypothetical protein
VFGNPGRDLVFIFKGVLVFGRRYSLVMLSDLEIDCVLMAEDNKNTDFMSAQA